MGLVVSLLVACTQRGEKAAQAEAALEDPARATALASVRDVDAVTNEDLGHADVAVRRAAVRALSRMDDPRASTKLLSTLSDEDAETIAFSAHGLGWACEMDPSRAPSITKALVARSLSLTPEGTPRFDPTFAITQALARCTTKETEPTLAAFLKRPSPWNRGAALALGVLASQRAALSEATQTALLEAATELDEALFALARAEVASDLRPKLVEIAEKRLETQGPARLFALRALGRAGAKGAEVLAQALNEGDLDEAERTEAVRALARLGGVGQRALRAFVTRAMPQDDELESLEGAAFGPLLAAVEGLGTAWGREALQSVAKKPVPDDASPALVRRLDMLRCAAAKRLFDEGSDDPLLEGCDAAAKVLTRASPPSTGDDAKEPVPDRPVTLRFVTDAGTAALSIDPSLSPEAAARIVALAKAGYFDGTPIGHTIPGYFVRLGGAPKEGTTKPPALPRETSPLPFEAFTVGLALDGEGKHGSDELFVTLARLPELDGNYAWLGRADRSFAALTKGDVIEKVIVEE